MSNKLVATERPLALALRALHDIELIAQWRGDGEQAKAMGFGMPTPEREIL